MSQAARQTSDPEPINREPTQELAANVEPPRSADAGEANTSLLVHVLERARGGIRRHPFAAVGGAFAFGFVVGNGIPKYVAQTAVSMGLRALIQRALEEATVTAGS